jgi:uncharacterized membrane protein YedE/YeeE
MPTFAGLIAAVVALIAIGLGFSLLLDVLVFGPKHPVPPSLEWLPKFIAGAALGGAVAAFYLVRAWAKRWSLRRVSSNGK